MKNRLDELDSLRGLAALTVVAHHYLLIFPLFGIIHFRIKSMLY